MELVIDIPDEDYKFIKDLQSLIIGGRGNHKAIQYRVINAIRNGTPIGIEISGDAISRKAAQARIKAICDEYHLSYEDGPRKVSTGGSAYALGHAFDDLPPAVPKGEWIPVTYRPMTEEEVKEACEKWDVEEESLDEFDKRIFTCPLPDDGQEILVSHGKYVQEDLCSWDEDFCGLEYFGDWDGVDAWMPKPEPYKKEGEEE